MPSGPAHWWCCALIALLAACAPLSLTEQAQLALTDAGEVNDSMIPFDDLIADTPMEGGGGPVDAPIEGGGPDAPSDAMDPPDAMVPDVAIDAPVLDAGVPDSSVPDASVPDASVPDGSVPPVDGGLVDGGPGDGSLSDAVNPDAREPPGLPVGGSHDDEIKSFYACSTGDGASALPLLLAILALRRRQFRGSGMA